MTKRAAATARSVAETTLARVLVDRSFAASALESEIARHPQLDPRDRGLATELVYGTLQVFPWLEGRLGRHAPRGLAQLRPRVRAALALSAYQVFFLDRVPSYAAVNEAVSAVRNVSGDKVAGFANAILRKLVHEAGDHPESLADAIVASTAPWLARALERSIGAEAADAMLRDAATPPPIGLRAPDAASRSHWLAELRAVAPEAKIEEGRVSPLAILVRDAGRPQDLPPVHSGALAIQEEGSQLVALALGATAGERVLDACAGRGHKTAVLARAVTASGATGIVDAADLHPPKLDRLQQDLAAQRLAARATFPVDWSIGSGEVPGDYDAVLVDAPCSGVGTLRRRPDLLLTRSAESVAELARLQAAVLRNAASRVRDGGRLIFAVCSVLDEEAERVVAAAALDSLGFAPAHFPEGPARNIFGERTAGRLLPQVHGTDGYFLASFLRTGLRG